MTKIVPHHRDALFYTLWGREKFNEFDIATIRLFYAMNCVERTQVVVFPSLSITQQWHKSRELDNNFSHIQHSSRRRFSHRQIIHEILSHIQWFNPSKDVTVSLSIILISDFEDKQHTRQKLICCGRAALL